ncbi:MAG: hydantoinase B/oxoprolinase family protein, partial [Planctomycetaceae bacterium]
MPAWEFWIDVGGTFTDCLARSPENRLLPCKVLSSGVTKGRIDRVLETDQFCDLSRTGDAADFWRGYGIRIVDETGETLHTGEIFEFDNSSGLFRIHGVPPEPLRPGMRYELFSSEEAPLLAIRRVLGLRLDDAIPDLTVKLGTTRGTNALLTRNGARTAFVTTRGFADVLIIANQDRPRLFDLAIKKPEPLFERVVEINERLDASGNVLMAPEVSRVRAQLSELRAAGIDSIAICLLHSFANPTHEELVAKAARDAGFSEISVSSRLSPLIKIVSRGDTTVLDAYLNPILRNYVSSIRSKLGTSRLQIMTSAGGLVDADRFVGKDSILSGPAGGVVGFSRVAMRAGYRKSIGFDMGGTSTDVSRFDGRYEYEFETKKAGVRVVSPMLAIETVAAGGGSICGFDGVKLHVGPASAGADPGPACYGRGGPLTVTDVNLYLGRILPERFPFALDRGAVERRLQSLCTEIARSPLGRNYSPVELATGFVQIADANMVRAIRNISVARGYDPREYALVTFGGAGGQHACGVARALGIDQILLHPYAGILSAYGIGLADVRRFGERAVLKPYNSETLAALDDTFAEMEARAAAEVREEGIAAEQLQTPIRSLDLRYRGVESTINVERPTNGDYAARYEELHEQLFGYRHRNRSIEIVAARVEVVGTIPSPEESFSDVVDRSPRPSSTTTTYFEGSPVTTAVFDRKELQPGDRFAGPAILCEPTSTIVVEPGFEARVLAAGEVLLSRAEANPGKAGPPKNANVSSVVDPVQLEIFNNLFAAIAEQMGITLQRTSCSTNVKERLDFSCAVFAANGDLVVNAPHIPVHLGAMGETVKRIIADNPDLAAGDVYVTNDPYRGGSHLPDVTVITPVHDSASGRLIFFTASRAHHAEIGGIVPGSMPPFSKTLAQEGVLIRNFKLVDRGQSREEELRALLANAPYPSRAVADNLADTAAQVAANNVGVRQLGELVERYSIDVVQAYMRYIQEAAAAKMRLALARIPDGRYQRIDHLDDGSPIAVSISISGENATVDFSGTGPVLASNLNANRAIVTAAVLYVFRCLINEDIPLNSGVLEPVEIRLPECLLNPRANDDPSKSPAVVGGNVETSQRVVDVLLGALGLAAASQGTMNNLTFGDSS